MKLRTFSLSLLVILSFGSRTRAAEVERAAGGFRIYSLRDLGSVNLANSSIWEVVSPGFLNNRGECLIGGQVWLPEAAHTLPAGWTDFRHLGLQAWGGISDTLQILAVTNSNGSLLHAWWQGGTLDLFPRRPDQSLGFRPTRILPDGRVLGLTEAYEFDRFGSRRFLGFDPAIWKAGFVTPLAVPLGRRPQVDSGVVLDANSNGQAIGVLRGTSPGENRFVLWDGAGLRSIAGAPTPAEANPFDSRLGSLATLNGRGETLLGPWVYAGVAPRDYWLYLQQPAYGLAPGLHKTTELDATRGNLCQASGLNDRGELIGVQASVGGNPARGLVWDLNYPAPDLLTTLTSDPRAASAWPRAINGAGQILCVDNTQALSTPPELGDTRVFLMAPALECASRTFIEAGLDGSVLVLAIQLTNVSSVTITQVTTNTLLANLVDSSSGVAQIIPITPDQTDAKPRSLAPGEFATLSFRYRMDSRFLATPGNIRFTLGGTTAEGITLSSTLQRQAFRIDSLFRVEVTATPARVGTTDPIEVLLTAINGTTNQLTGVHPGGNASVTGTGGVQHRSGPLPTGSVTLGPGQHFTFTNSFIATNHGTVNFGGQMLATDPRGGALSASAFSNPVRIAPRGDLLLKRGIEPDGFYSADGLYLTVPGSPQTRTNAVVPGERSEFQVRIENDEITPQSFRLHLLPGAPLGWASTYRLDGEEVTRQFQIPGGTDLPELAPGSAFTLTISLQPTNAPPGDIQRVRIALGLKSDPTLTLDVVEAVSELSAEIVVNSTGDLPDQDPEDCCADTGRTLKDGTPEVTLRAAIGFANRHAGKDRIRFRIPADDIGNPSGTPRIEPKTALPPITQPLIIDGWSQNPKAAHPPVELAGDKLPTGLSDQPDPRSSPDLMPGGLFDFPGGISGLVVESGDSEIRGLVINRFPFCGVELGGGGNVIQQNYIGTDPEGRTAKANGAWGFWLSDETFRSTDTFYTSVGVRGCGIWVRSPLNLVGGANAGNVLSGVNGARRTPGTYDLLEVSDGGIADIAIPPDLVIDGPGAIGNQVQGNLFGSQSDGHAPIDISFAGRLKSTGNREVLDWDGHTAGIIVATPGNSIGGVAPGTGNSICGNLSLSIGIWLIGPGARNNLVQGNSFGTDLSGTVFIGGGIGILVEGSANEIGGLEMSAGNRFQGHGGSAIVLSGGLAIGNRIEGNQIGPVRLPLTPLRSGRDLQNWDGIAFEKGASQNVISSNTIANSLGRGISFHPGPKPISPPMRGNIVAYNNIFGSGSEGVAPLLNCTPGIRLSQNSTHDNGLLFLESKSAGNEWTGEGCLPSPVLFTAVESDGTIRISGNLSTPLGRGNYPIEFFANRFSRTGRGEGESYLGSADLEVGFGGLQGFNVTLPTAATSNVGLFLTANATSPNETTSAFSNAVLVQDCVPGPKGLCPGLEGRVPNLVNTTPSVVSSSGVSAGLLSSRDFQLQGSPRTGDGNGDGVPDGQQGNVASFPGVAGVWMTLAAPAGAALIAVTPDGLPAGLPSPSGFLFPVGFIRFNLENVPANGAVNVTNFLHLDAATNLSQPYRATTVYNFGPTPEESAPHWYEFNFDGTTGAELRPDRVILHFRDGARGDHDLSRNGAIVTAGAPAQPIPSGPPLSIAIDSVQSVEMTEIQISSGAYERTTNLVSVVTSVLSWPAEAANGFLETLDQLHPEAPWRLVQETPTLVGDRSIILHRSATPARYYRLRPY